VLKSRANVVALIDLLDLIWKSGSGSRSRQERREVVADDGWNEVSLGLGCCGCRAL